MMVSLPCEYSDIINNLFIEGKKGISLITPMQFQILLIPHTASFINLKFNNVKYARID